MLNKKVAILVHYSLIFRYKTDIPEKNLYINEPAHEIDILNAWVMTEGTEEPVQMHWPLTFSKNG